MPKVLIFGQSFNSNTGGGVTLSNLFQNWSKDDLAVVCTGHANGNISPGICENYYFIGSDEIHWIYPFRFFQRDMPSGNLPIISNNQPDSFSFKPSFRKLFISKVLFPFLEWTSLSYIISKMKVSNNLINWVNKFSPDILYIQVTSRESLLFAIKLSDVLNIPMVLHQMDDWIGSISNSGLGKGYWLNKINSEFGDLVSRATLCLSICDYMGKEYQERYKSEFITYHNPVDLKVWLPKTERVINKGKELSILYAGRTGFGINTSLKSFAKAVEVFNSKSQIKLKFYIQTAEKLTWPDDFEHTFHRDLVAYEKLPQLFQSMDFLLLPVDFSEKAIRFLKYSMPTKASEYMISGTPIIIFSPEETAIFQYGKAYDWAFLINEDSPEKISKKLLEIATNTEAKAILSENALSLAKKRHSLEVVSNEFHNEFEKLLK